MAKVKVKVTRIAKLRNAFGRGKAFTLPQLVKETGSTPGTVTIYIHKLRREGVEIVSERGNSQRPTTYRLAGRKGRANNS